MACRAHGLFAFSPAELAQPAAAAVPRQNLNQQRICFWASICSAQPYSEYDIRILSKNNTQNPAQCVASNGSTDATADAMRSILSLGEHASAFRMQINSARNMSNMRNYHAIYLDATAISGCGVVVYQLVSVGWCECSKIRIEKKNDLRPSKPAYPLYILSLVSGRSSHWLRASWSNSAQKFSLICAHGRSALRWHAGTGAEALACTDHARGRQTTDRLVRRHRARAALANGITKHPFGA